MHLTHALSLEGTHCRLCLATLHSSSLLCLGWLQCEVIIITSNNHRKEKNVPQEREERGIPRLQKGHLHTVRGLKQEGWVLLGFPPPGTFVRDSVSPALHAHTSATKRVISVDLRLQVHFKL